MPSILTKFLIAIIVGATTGCSDKISQMDTDLSGKAGSDLTQPIFENDYQRSHQTAREQLEKASMILNEIGFEYTQSANPIKTNSKR